MSLITSNNGLKTTNIDAQNQLVDMMESMVIFNDKANQSVDKELVKTVQTFKEVMVKMEKNMTLLMEENILLKKQLIKLESDKTINEVLHQQEKKASDERVQVLEKTMMEKIQKLEAKLESRLNTAEDTFNQHTHVVSSKLHYHDGCRVDNRGLAIPDVIPVSSNVPNILIPKK